MAIAPSKLQSDFVFKLGCSQRNVSASLVYVCSVQGGSAANVLKGLGNLALQQRSARFMGMVGLDDAGR